MTCLMLLAVIMPKPDDIFIAYGTSDISSPCLCRNRASDFQTSLMYLFIFMYAVYNIRINLTQDSAVC